MADLNFSQGADPVAIFNDVSGNEMVVNTDGSINTSDIIAQGAATAGKLGNMTMGAVTTAAPTYVTGQLDPLSLDTSGNLRVSATPATDLFGNVTFNAVSQSTIISTQGRATIQIYSIGTWVGSIGFLGSVDGSTFFNILGFLPNGIIANGFASNTSFTIPCGGYLDVKIVTSAWTSGTAVVYWDASIAANPNLQPTFRMIDFAGNGLTSQANGSQRALDVGIDVAGVQIDPRQVRALTSSDTVTVVQPTGTNLHTVVDSSALPTGAATAANQATEIASLAAIDAGIPSALGQTTMAASMPVVIASNQSAIPVVEQSSTGSDTLNSLGDLMTVSTLNYGDMLIHVTGAFVGTITPYITVNGSQVYNIPVLNLSTGTLTSTITTTGMYRIPCANTYSVQLYMSAYTSGSAVIYWVTSSDVSMVEIGSWLGSQLPTVGQKVSTSCIPVVLASDQAAINVAQIPVRWATAVAATGVAVTLTLAAVAGQFHYINSIEIQAYSTAARTGSATPITVTSTNIPTGAAWTFATAAAIGTTDNKFQSFSNNLKSTTVNTATTIVCPATTGILWRVNVSYYTGI